MGEDNGVEVREEEEEEEEEEEGEEEEEDRQRIDRQRQGQQQQSAFFLVYIIKFVDRFFFICVCVHSIGFDLFFAS